MFSVQEGGVVSNVTLTTNPDLERGLVGHWTFDGKHIDFSQVTAEARDRSENANHGDWQNHASTTVQGRIGQGLSFGGEGDYVDVGNAGSGVQTVAFWLKTSSTTQQIIDLNGTAYIDVSGNTIQAEGFTSPTIYIDGVVSSVIDEKWHHVTVTTGTGVNASDMDIGRVEEQSYFEGKLDDVRIYTRALSAKEVLRLSQLGR